MWWSFRVHDGQLLSGAVAFYGLLAAAPFAVIAVTVASLVIGQDAAATELARDLAPFVGEETGRYLGQMAGELSITREGWFATAFSVGFLFFATTRLFWMLRSALNHCWGVRSRADFGFRGRALAVLQKRLLAFAMVLLFGVALLVLLLMKAVLSYATLALDVDTTIPRIIEFGSSLLVLTVMMLLLFRWLPDAQIRSRDLLPGAFLTSVLVGLGSLLFGAFLARFDLASAYGAAGSVMVLLFWIYTTAHLFFLGAEFTGAWARHRGDGIHPMPHAVAIVVKEGQTIV